MRKLSLIFYRLIQISVDIYMRKKIVFWRSEIKSAERDLAEDNLRWWRRVVDSIGTESRAYRGGLWKSFISSKNHCIQISCYQRTSMGNLLREIRFGIFSVSLPRRPHASVTSARNWFKDYNLTSLSWLFASILCSRAQAVVEPNGATLNDH